MVIDNNALLECYINFLPSVGIPFVLDYQTIRASQIGEAWLEALQQWQPQAFIERLIAPKINLICYALDLHTE